MNSEASPDASWTTPPLSAATASIVRVVVVPTLTTRRPSRCAVSMVGGGSPVDLEWLGMDPMLLHDVGPHGLEGAVADVERDLRARDAARLECGQQVWREVESGCRRRNGAGPAGIDGLVSIAIRLAVGPLDVGRQRDVPDGVDDFRHRATVRRPKTNRAPPERMLCQHLGLEARRGLAENRMRARLHLLARVHEHVPPLIVELTQQEALDLAPAGLAAAEQARGDHARVVDHEQI